MRWWQKASRIWCAGFVGCSMTVALGATPASAAASITDGFESATEAEWYLFAEGPELCFASQYGSQPICETPGHAVISRSKGEARSGDNYLYMYNAGEYSTITVADRYVNLPSDRSTCSASIYVKPVNFPYDRPIRAKIEVNDPDPWTRIKKKTFELTRDATDWQKYTVTWSGGPDTVIVRLLLRGDTNYLMVGLYADDLKVSCIKRSTKP